MIEWSLKTLAIKDLKPHPKNPRQISKQQIQHLEELIDKFGLIDKPVVNLDNQIIGGHQRVKILKKQKVRTVECWVPDHMLDEKEVEHLMIGHNLNQGAWDFEALANGFDALDLLAWGFDEQQLLGKFEEEIEKIEEKQKEDESAKKNMCPACGFEY